MPTFEHLKQMEFLSRSVFSKAAGKEGLSSSLVSKTFRVPLSSRPWWPLHSTSLSCNNTESSLTLAYCMTWKGNHATKMRGGQTRQRSLVGKGKSRIRRLGAFSTNREYVATKKKKKKFHSLIIKWPSSQFLKNECSDFKKGILPKVHWNPNKDCLHLMHYNCQISNRIKSELLIHFPKFE